MSASQSEFRPAALPLTARTKTLVGAAFATAVGAWYVAFTKDWGAAMAAAKDGLDVAQVYGMAMASFGAMGGVPLYTIKRLSSSDDEIASGVFYAMTPVLVALGVAVAQGAHEDALAQAQLAQLPLLPAHTIIKAVPVTAQEDACNGIMYPKRELVVYEGKDYAVKCPGAHPLMPN